MKTEKIKHNGGIMDKVGEYSVIDCKSCGFRHVMPIPINEELEKLYSQEFYSHAKPKYFSDYEEDIDWWMATYKNQYGLLARHTKGRRLLDVGSGPGYFLKCGKGLGWDVLGFEPSAEATRYSKKHGVKVVNEFFTAESASSYGKFDVVYLSMVIEHLPNPLKILRDAISGLKPGGLLAVMSPNDYNPLQETLRKHSGFKPWWLSPPQHINYFNFESIKKVVEKLGLSVVESMATFPLETFLLSGDNYLGNRKLGRKCQEKRKIFEMNMYEGNPEALNDMYRALGAKGIGRQFLLIAKKKK